MVRTRVEPVSNVPMYNYYVKNELSINKLTQTSSTLFIVLLSLIFNIIDFLIPFNYYDNWNYYM